jgi:hypothetical protein
MPSRFVIALATSLIAAPGFAQGPAASATYFEAAKITVNARARADGFFRVRVVPENGPPREATLPILRRMNENDLAGGLATALNAVLGPEYVADRDAGEHVKIEKKDKAAANFSVEITFNAPGFAVILDN